MSADLSRKQSRQGSNGQTVLPQSVSNPSIIESVAGFIHEVVPQAYSSVLPGETRESISWARFEVTDYNDPENYSQVSECESESTPPLLLVLGYNTGVQVWGINGGGDATELLSWSQGAVRTLRLLDRPKDGPDLFMNKRPLVAVVDSSGPGPQFCTVNFVSLKTAEVIKSIKFKTPICDIHCNKKSVVITFTEKIAVFDVGTLEDRLTVTTCYPSPGACINPVALGSRWLAYAEKRLTTWQRSSGGCESDGSQSYTATVIHAAKSLSKGLRDLSGSLTGTATSTTNNNAAHPGIVTIIDIELKPVKEDDPENLICHFVGHVGPIVAMTFDPSGLLLVTADKHGHRFHVYRIQPHPCCPQLASVHHLYILHRGETTARVQDIAVSLDSRWVAVSSVRGTTHVFPITPYGGPVTVRTHSTPHVVNRLSRFERSAGLSDGRGSPLPEVPCQPSTPRLPPYPVPCVLLPLAQIRRTDESPLAAAFAVPRAWIPGQPSRQNKRSLLDSLFVISTGGSLIQYDLEPKPIPGIAKDKISYDTGIELGVDAKAEWPLLKPPYTSNLQPPLPPTSPLLVTTIIEHATDPRTTDDRWMSQVEIVTHTGPHRRLWMGPQFSFKSIDPLAPSGFEINPQNDNMKPTRSNPVNMPHRPFLLVESGSAGSVESPHLTDYGSSGEDIQQGESRLREDLADAMLETATNNSGVMVGGGSRGDGSGSGAGGRLRAALLERQVNPLGTVITLPTGGHDQQLLVSTTERRQHHHQYQLYHHVLPAGHQSHIKSPAASVISSSEQDNIKVASCSSTSSSGSVKKKDKSHHITDKGHTMKTTCVEVQTIPLESMSDQKIPSSTLTKSIQTSSSEKKSSKSEQKVKTKSKKKSTKNSEESISASASTSSNVKQSQEVKIDMDIADSKSSTKRGTNTKFKHVEQEAKGTLGRSNDFDNKMVSLDTANEPLESKFNIVLSEEGGVEVESATCAALTTSLPEISITVQPEKSVEEDQDILVLTPVPPPPHPPSSSSNLCTTASEENMDNRPEDKILPFAPSEVIIEDEVLAEKLQKKEDVTVGSKLTEVEYPDVDLLTDVTTYKSTGEDDVSLLEKSIEEKIRDLNSSEDNEVHQETFSESALSPGDIHHFSMFNDDYLDDGGATSKESLEHLIENIELDLCDDKIVLISSLEKSNDSDGHLLKDTSSSEPIDLDIESGESNSQKEESSVTGNDDIVTDSSDERKCKKEMVRKARVQESETSGKEICESGSKKQSSSPSKVEVKDDTESSDEPTSKASDSRSNSLKQVKRKKSGKKSADHTMVDDESSSTSMEIALKLKSKCHSEGALDIERSDYETCSEKKSDSSVESFPEYKKKLNNTSGDQTNFSETKSWSSVVKNIDKEPLRPSNSAEDRDSVYESCNDEDFPALEVTNTSDQTAFESSKEEFDEPNKLIDVTKIESGSSNTEEKTDSGERDMFTSIKNLKKVKKQKKRKR